MTRPTRRKLGLVVFLTGAVVAGAFLVRHPAVLAIVAAVLVLVVVLTTVHSREFFKARSAQSKGRHEVAIEQFQRYVRRLEPAGVWRRGLAFTLYTHCPVALAQNNIAVSLMSLRRFDEAKSALSTALKHDAKYAVPHVNLGIIATIDGDGPSATQSFATAKRLGFSEQVIDRTLRNLIGKTNTTIGDAIEPQSANS